MGMFHYYDLPGAEIFVFDDFLICQIGEGMEIHPEHNTNLKEVIEKHFLGKHIGYISNRVNSYSVDPLTYVETEKIPNLLAMAIIPETEIMRKNAEYERNFYDKPYEIFDCLGDAINWIHCLIREKTNS
ncbi:MULTISPECIES: hypothetical protein [Bizionia]|uniref:STAS/SEC14 domain-containing protein n=1 Tax=Bizionia algoritergicola TaxID=291187 RepID=A0A5D0QUP2_9FLAO|nr:MULTISPECIES: hypothetical protein [Bizionia]OBX22814.1 hypothetical protein BAA08_07220 [Bizionia sp. APA-3]TYB72411.1 hypothetical protein ES675_11660 [Bizionia algoritergicola]